jgi:hypothetical protein
MSEAVNTNNETNVMYKVRISYKSGYVIEAWFDKMNIKSAGGAITSVEWKVSASENMKILHLGLDEIESIIQIDVKDKAE